MFEISQRDFPDRLDLRVNPISPSRNKIIIMIHEMPGIIYSIIPLDAVHIRAEDKVVQSIGTVMSSGGRITHHVPTWIKLDGLIGSRLGTIVMEKRGSWGGDVYPEAHGFVKVS